MNSDDQEVEMVDDYDIMRSPPWFRRPITPDELAARALKERQQNQKRIASELDELEAAAEPSVKRLFEQRRLREVYFDLIVQGRTAPRRCCAYDPAISLEPTDEKEPHCGPYLTNRRRSKDILPHLVVSMIDGRVNIEWAVGVQAGQNGE